jgi:hypothetical protein
MARLERECLAAGQTHAYRRRGRLRFRGDHERVTTSNRDVADRARRRVDEAENVRSSADVGQSTRRSGASIDPVELDDRVRERYAASAHGPDDEYAGSGRSVRLGPGPFADSFVLRTDRAESSVGREVLATRAPEMDDRREKHEARLM